MLTKRKVAMISFFASIFYAVLTIESVLEMIVLRSIIDSELYERLSVISSVLAISRAHTPANLLPYHSHRLSLVR